MSVPVVYIADAYSIAGYSNSARLNIKLLLQQGIDLRLKDISLNRIQIQDIETRNFLDNIPRDDGKSDKIVICHVCPDFYPTLGIQRFKKKIGITYSETTKIPPYWAENCNLMDEIWLACQMNIEVFRKSGVKCPLVLMKHPIDTTKFSPGNGIFSVSQRKQFMFLSVFQFIYRKGWDTLIRAFLRAFKGEKDVGLFIRTYRTGSASDRAYINAQISEIINQERMGSKDPIILIGYDPIPDQMMPSLYCSFDAFVLPSRGEAVCQPCLEAMSCEKPCIATSWGGPAEFMRPDISYPIGYKLQSVKPDPMSPWYLPDQQLAEPDINELIAAMQQVYRNQGQAKQRAVKARQFVRNTYDSMIIGDKMAIHLNKIIKSL